MTGWVIDHVLEGQFYIIGTGHFNRKHQKLYLVRCDKLIGNITPYPRGLANIVKPQQVQIEVSSPDKGSAEPSVRGIEQSDVGGFQTEKLGPKVNKLKGRDDGDVQTEKLGPKVRKFKGSDKAGVKTG